MGENGFNNYEMSWVPKINKSKRPIYMELASVLERDIKNGLIRPGTKLPPQRELADYLGINLSTVSKAVQVCMKKGLISASVGSGTYVSYDALLDGNSIRRNRVIIDMSVPQPESGGFDEIVTTIKTMLSEPTSDEWFGYGDIEGVAWHREAASRLIERLGYRPNANSIRFSSGGQNALAAILCSVFERGDKIGTDPFTYIGLKKAAKLFDVELVPISGRDGIMDEESIAEACRKEHIKGLYVMPGYQTPNIEMLPEDRKPEIARAAKEHSLIVIEDAVNILRFSEGVATVAQHIPEQTFFLASVSKTFASGLRIAAVVCPERYCKTFDNALYCLNLCGSPFMEELACRLMVSNRERSIINKHDKSMAIRNRCVDEILGDYVIGGNSKSIHRWIKMPEGIDETDFEKKAMILGVSVRASAQFAVGNTKPYNAVRITPSTPSTVWKLKEGLKILRQLLDSLDEQNTKQSDR
ncbi:MAG: PLP-dependent aminotransferase family protein [Oscillospiraceae bacterium]|nr:PLP-dependent aminotransferase family protein [Oscillospiraceae bacterium]